MYASRVKISQETRSKLNNPVLDSRKKSELRVRLVLDKINNNPGVRFTKQELLATAGYNPSTNTQNYQTGLAFIRNMEKRGLIAHNNTRTFRKHWFVLSEATIKTTPKQVAKSILAKSQLAEKPVVEEVDIKKGVQEIVTRPAKDFVWETNSDSLHEFVKYLQD